METRTRGHILVSEESVTHRAAPGFRWESRGFDSGTASSTGPGTERGSPHPLTNHRRPLHTGSGGDTEKKEMTSSELPVHTF